ncbi:Serine/threonine-protein kinase RIO3 [Armadillidium vulgare]|nr:Serine/threonine-protein kinase RIO3 [Armadillidium vulgare]
MSCCQESVLESKGSNVGPVWKNTQIVDSPPNPWNRTKTQDESRDSTLSFRDLMSEDLAKTLQQREEAKYFPEVESCIASSTLGESEPTTDTSSDFMLAYLLQQSYNKEHDTLVQREENHINKNSKLSLSFKNYKVSSEYLQEDDIDEDFQHIDDENRAVDKFEESKRTDPVIPACGYTRHNNQMITKHDKTLTGRRNAEKVMNFPPGFNTGDGGGFDMQIPNKVYNRLARTANEKDRKQRIRDKVDKATSIKAFDANSRLIIFKLLGSSVLENLSEIISTGKESVVVHAYGGTYEEEKLPDECAIKVFKTALTDFKTREKYIRNDYRFKDRMSKNNKMTIQLWAEKEFHNLRRLQKAKIPSPKPFLVKNHVLLMSFIGNDSIAAPKLKHANLSYKEWEEAYKQVVDIMTTMYHSCKLIHGDMSEYNVLWHDNKCWVIDVGQAVEPNHPHALKFFYRDCTNIVHFFKSKGIPDIPSPLELFNIISGINLCGSEKEVDRLEVWYGDGEDKFEFFWNGTNNEKLSPPSEEVIESNNDLPLTKEHLSESEALPVETKKKTKRGKKKNKNNNNDNYNFIYVSTKTNDKYPPACDSPNTDLKDVNISDDSVNVNKL